MNIKDETWKSFRSALEKILAEAAPEQSAAESGPDVKRMVSEALGALLLEGNVLEKMLLRSIQKLPEDEKKALGDAVFPADALKRICEESFRSMTLQHLVPALQKQITERLNKQLVELGKTEEFKGLIDSRFRMMEQYLRSDVIPKVVKKTLSTQS